MLGWRAYASLVAAVIFLLTDCQTPGPTGQSSCIPWTLPGMSANFLHNPIDRLRAGLCDPRASKAELQDLLFGVRQSTDGHFREQDAYSQWFRKRRELTEAVFGRGKGLPERDRPDFVLPIDEVGYLIGWSVSEGGLTLNSSVFFFRRSGGRSVEERGERPLLLFHQGHDGAAPNTLPKSPHRRRARASAETNGQYSHFVSMSIDGSWQLALPTFCEGDVEPGDPTDALNNLKNVDCEGVAEWAWREFGADVMLFHLPLQGVNMVPGLPANHWFFLDWERSGISTMRFFVEPIIASINYAQEVAGYTRFALAGLSGGGWVTTLVAALDPRISISIPVAGTLPFDIRWPLKINADELADYENHPDRPIYSTCDMQCLYLLGALEEDRMQLQLLHEVDPCCFAAKDRHLGILAYSHEVNRLARGHFRSFVVDCDLGTGSHFLCKDDRRVIASLLQLAATGNYVDFEHWESPVIDELNNLSYLQHR